MSGTPLDLFSHVVIDFHVEDVCDEIQCILIVLHFCVKSSQVEAIRKIVLVDLAKVFVSARRYKLCADQYRVIS